MGVAMRQPTRFVPMLKSYVRLAYRMLLRQKVASAINLAGLSVAIGCSVVVYLFLQNYWTLDDFHANGETIFIVEHVVEHEGRQQVRGTSPVPLGPALEAAFPQVVRAVRLRHAGASVASAGKVFGERVTFADEGFFEMFTFPLRQGTPGALADPAAVVLSEAAALKYFGSEDPMGRPLTITFAGRHAATFTVQGVAAAFPANAGFGFDFLVRYDRQADVGVGRLEDWGDFTDGTFVQLRRANDAAALAAGLGRYVALQNAASDVWPALGYRLDNLRDPAPGAYEVYDRPAEAAHPAPVLMFSAIALLMLALSCFNYLNIALGAAARRLREIGVRKVVGGRKEQLVAQFMAENLILCFLALVVGIGVARVFLMPLFNAVMVMQVTLSLAENAGLWMFLAGLLAAVAVASGAYPAFYVASFQPVAVLRGRLKLGDRKWLTGTLLALQFVMAFVTVITGTVLHLNGGHLARLDWGYDASQTLVVRLASGDRYAILRDAALQHPDVVAVAGAGDHVGEGARRSTVEAGGAKNEVVRYDVGPGYLEALGLRLRAGRVFDERFGSDASQAVVVNAAFAKAQGWEEPVGQALRLDGEPCTVAGVVDDFLVHPAAGMRPAVFRLADPAGYGYLVVRFAPGAGAQTVRYLEGAWQRLQPGTPLDAFFQTAVFDGFRGSYGRLTRAFGYVAALALVLSCLGLFGLASQHFARSLKEVSIRKVLGATAGQIVVRVNRRFLLLLGLASVVATTTTYLAFRAVVDGLPYASHLSVDPLPFAVANLLVFGAAGLAIGTQVYRLLVASPADVLRNE